MNPSPAVIRYWIDATDRVVRVNEEWERFAAENAGGAVGPASAILGQEIWTFLTDMSLRSLYAEMVKLARLQRPVSFKFRCDAPGFRRVFRMRITGHADGVVEFASTLVSEEARPDVSLLDCRQTRSAQFVRMCSWCQRVEVGGRWIPVEQAMSELCLVAAPTLPAITHGLCDSCYTKMRAKIDLLTGVG